MSSVSGTALPAPVPPPCAAVQVTSTAYLLLSRHRRVAEAAQGGGLVPAWMSFVWNAVCWPLLTASSMVYIPAVAHAWLAVLPVAVPPSPKSQL